MILKNCKNSTKPSLKQAASLKMPPNHRYTCREYREEMTLLGLNQRLKDADLTEEERRRVEEDIRRLETEMGMD